MKVTTIRPFGSRLKEALKDSGVTQADLARHFKITPQAINQWTTAKTPPELEIDRWISLSQILNTNLDWLCLGTGRKGRVEMTDQAFDFLRRFQMLNDRDREIVNNMMNTMLVQRDKAENFPAGKRR